MRGECLCCYKYKKNNFEKTHKKIDDEEELKGGG